MGASMGRPDDRVTNRLAGAELFEALGERPFEHDFFQLMRRLECAFEDAPRIGTALRPADEPIRLGQDPSLAFAPASLAALRPGRKGGPPWLLVNFLGLLGPNGPLPLHLTDFARERLLHAGDPTFPRFLDIFHHRFLAMFYRAWSQAQPTVRLDRPTDDGFARYVGSFVGIGTGEFRSRDALNDHAKYFYSGWLSRNARNRDGLVALLRGFFDVSVRVDEFVGHWLRLPRSERTRVGRDDQSSVLGRGAVIGKRVWDLQHKFRIELGPLNLRQYEQFLPGGRALGELVTWVRTYLGFELEWDLLLALRAHEVPRARLGVYGQLGWTTWLGKYRRREPARNLALDAERFAGDAAGEDARDRRRAVNETH
jgi:type VI secretion system protein ImpH